MAERYFQRRSLLSVWCGALGNYITGTHFFVGRLTAAYDRDFLQNDLPLYLKDVPFATGGRMWIQHDEAPPYFGREVTEFLSG
jgi:hypothetical protein